MRNFVPGQDLAAHTFTPLYNGERVAFRVSPVDAGRLSPSGRGFRGIVSDVDDGKEYMVFGISCGCPGCDCDLLIADFENDEKADQVVVRFSVEDLACL